MNKNLMNLYIDMNNRQLREQYDYLFDCIKYTRLTREERIIIYKQMTFIKALIKSKILYLNGNK